MEKVNLPLFYRLGTHLNPLKEMQPDASGVFKFAIAALRASDSTRILLQQFPALSVCRATGEELITTTEKVITWLDKTPNEKLQESYPSAKTLFQDVIEQVRKFEILLTEELHMIVAYHITKKGIYSVQGLIERAEDMLPDSTREKIGPDVAEEIRQSGRCLAFDNSTASGFHIIRAIEALMHDYYIFVCKPASKKKLNGWADYISALHNLTNDTNVKESIRGDVKKVIALLQQIKDQDRNLIMHPEVVLTPDDAHKLFEIAKGAIIAIADGLPAPKKQ